MPPRCKQGARAWMATLILRVMRAHNVRNILASLTIAGCALQITPQGRVIGWAALLGMLNGPAREIWNARHDDEHLDATTVLDIMKFVMFLVHWRDANERTRRISKTIIHNLLHMFVAPTFDFWVLRVYGASNDLNRPARILRQGSPISGSVDPDAAWEVLERSRLVSRASPQTIIGARCDLEHLAGLSVRNGSNWAEKELTLYLNKEYDLFCRACKFAIVADPSVYVGQDCLLGVIYSWQIDVAAIGACQKISQSKRVIPGDFDMREELMALVAGRKAERLAALKEWQAISNLLCQSTGKSTDNLRTPDSCHLKPVGPDEVRIVDDADPLIDKEIIYNRVTRQGVRVLPDDQDPGVWPQATVVLDSGSIGRAGALFAMRHLRLNLFCLWDKIHRCIRDIKLALEHSVGGYVHRALLHMCYIWSLNAKPQGSGVWHELKKTMLDGLLRGNNSTLPIFRKYAEQYAKDVGHNLFSEADFDQLWQSLIDIPGFMTKLENVKPSRWFSTNGRFVAERTGFWPLKMVLGHHLFGAAASDRVDDEYTPVHRNAKKDMAELRAASAGGGFLLAEKLLTHWLHDHIRIWFYATKASWTFYDTQIDEVKNSKHAVAFFVKMAAGNWVKEIGDIFVNCFEVYDHLKDMSLDWNASNADMERQQELVDTLADFAFTLSEYRTWSLLIYEIPPFPYAGLLTSSDARKAAAIAAMKFDSSVLYGLEAARLTVPVVDEVLKDMCEIFIMAIRILYATYTRDKFRPNSNGGHQHLATMLMTLPDSKLVEDLHQHCKDLQKESRNMVSTPVTRMRACIDSGVLEFRELRHPRVTKNEFRAGFRQKRKG